MKSIIKIAFVSVISFSVLACGSSSKKERESIVAEKKDKLSKLKKEQVNLLAEIKKLEDELVKIDTASAKLENAKLVVLDTVRIENFTHYIDLQGRIDAENISYISPRGMGGQVRAIYVKEGDKVRKGQLLLKLDDAVARQNVVAMRQSMESVKTQLALARTVYERQENLWKQNIGTEVQLLQAKSN